MSQSIYWRFYWPLALTGLVSLLASQFRNGVLARFDQPELELAHLAYATSVVFLLNAALVFVPQFANVLARTRAAHVRCLWFTVGISILLTLPLLWLSLTGAGQQQLVRSFDLSPQARDVVVRYVLLLSPVILLSGLRGYYTGMLVQVHRTGMVTLLNSVYLFGVVAVLLIGYRLQWGSVSVMVLSEVVPSCVHLVLTLVAYGAAYRTPGAPPDEPTLTRRMMWAFFWPVALTSVMFAASRPIIYAFVSRQADSEAMVAALRVAFDLAMIFHMPVNQFRHVYTTFGFDDAAGLRRFTFWVTLGITLLMLLVGLTPIAGWVLGEMLGVRGAVLEMSRHAFIALAAIPAVVAVRNFYHGRLMVVRRTLGMAVGGVLRVAAIYAASFIMAEQGWLTHTTAAAALVVGFGVETVVVALAYLRNPEPARERDS